MPYYSLDAGAKNSHEQKSLYDIWGAQYLDCRVAP
jgi:hypothetical protein